MYEQLDFLHILFNEFPKNARFRFLNGPIIYDQYLLDNVDKYIKIYE